jgi:hypothetical protein
LVVIFVVLLEIWVCASEVKFEIYDNTVGVIDTHR